LLISSLKTES
jgi:hypothetical protein